MGWIKEPIRDTNEIFNEIVSNGWSGRIGDSTTPYEYWVDYIRDYYDVTLKQCDEICKMIKEHYKIKLFYWTDYEKAKKKNRRMAKLLDLYVGGDCISQHRYFKNAKKAFDKAVKKYPDIDIDIMFEDESIYAWDSDNQTIHDYRPYKKKYNDRLTIKVVGYKAVGYLYGNCHGQLIKYAEHECESDEEAYKYGKEKWLSHQWKKFEVVPIYKTHE
jgi:hypothetical protein